MRVRRIALCVVAALSVGCASDRANSRAVVVTRHDSAGWRFVALPNAGLELRYPARQIQTVDNRWSAQCDSSPRVTLLPSADTNSSVLVVSSMPNAFPAIARRLGFALDVRGPGIICVGDGCARDHWTMPDSGEWRVMAYADSVRVGNWRGLYTIAELRAYFDDDSANTTTSDDTTDVRRPPGAQYQFRFFAAAPRSNGCAVVLSLLSAPVRDIHGGADSAAWDGLSIRHMLEGATVKP